MAQETGFDDPIRKSWKKGSKLEIYSESKEQWYNGKIERIFHDEEGEWLAIKYNGFNLKEVQRFTQFIRPIQRRKKTQTKDDDDSKETEPPKQQHRDNGEEPRKSTKAIGKANDDRKSSNIESTESTQSIPIDSDQYKSQYLEALKAYKKEEGSRVPCTILTGFLGAGKTTLLNHLLSENHGLKFAIIENEFGEVGIDEKILGNDDIKEMVDEEIIEVMNGCICCKVRGDLVTTLKKLYEKVAKFDGVIIETTGLADPAPVAQTFMIDDDVEDMYSLDAIITVVDAKHLILRLDDDQRSKSSKNVAREQLAFADMVLLNKIDLVPEEKELKKIESRIRDINPHTNIIRCTQSKVDWHRLLGVGAFDIDKVLEFKPNALRSCDGNHDTTITSVSVQFDGELLVMALEDWIEGLLGVKGADLFRYKGVMACKGMDKKFIFQGVGMTFFGGFSEISWGKDEKRECCFVFIGRNLKGQELIDGFKACRVPDDMTLRFEVGDPVLANYHPHEESDDEDHDHHHDHHHHHDDVEPTQEPEQSTSPDVKESSEDEDEEEDESAEVQWAPGHIVKQWEEGSPYRIVLSDGNMIMCPIDDDDFVRFNPDGEKMEQSRVDEVCFQFVRQAIMVKSIDKLIQSIDKNL